MINLLYRENNLGFMKSEIFEHCELISISPGILQSVEFILKYKFQYPTTIINKAKKEYEANLSKILRAYRRDLEV